MYLWGTHDRPYQGTSSGRFFHCTCGSCCHWLSDLVPALLCTHLDASRLPSLPEMCQMKTSQSLSLFLSFPQPWNSVVWVFPSSCLIGWKHLDVTFFLNNAGLPNPCQNNIHCDFACLGANPTWNTKWDPWSESPRDKEGHRVRNLYENALKTSHTSTVYVYAQTQRHLQCSILLLSNSMKLFM